jgi:Zinc-finger of C2H2 type
VSQISEGTAWDHAAGSSGGLPGWQLVDPEDLIPVVDISVPVDSIIYNSTRLPSYDPDYGPEFDAEVEEELRRNREYQEGAEEENPDYSYYDQFLGDYPLEETLSPTSSPRRQNCDPRTPLEEENPHRYRAGPAPTPPRPTKHIKKRKAITIEQRAVRAERKRKPREKKGRYCKVCKLECNSRLAFADHLNSRGHLYHSGVGKASAH